MMFFSLFVPLKGQHLGLTSPKKETALKEIGVRIQNLLTVQDSIVNTHTHKHTHKQFEGGGRRDDLCGLLMAHCHNYFKLILTSTLAPEPYEMDHGCFKHIYRCTQISTSRIQVGKAGSHWRLLTDHDHHFVKSLIGRTLIGGPTSFYTKCHLNIEVTPRLTYTGVQVYETRRPEHALHK